MNTKTVNPTYAFETRQRSLAPVVTTFQGRSVSMRGFTPVGTGAPVAKLVGGISAPGHTAIALGTTTDPRLRRTSPL
jgi:hypothetical protein